MRIVAGILRPTLEPQPELPNSYAMAIDEVSSNRRSSPPPPPEKKRAEPPPERKEAAREAERPQEEDRGKKVNTEA